LKTTKTIIINLFGAPGAGKSTSATELFSKLKKLHLKCEYLHEYAKDLIYSKDDFKLKDQIYILAKQRHPILRMEDNNVDIVITDGAYIIGNVFLNDDTSFAKEFKALNRKLFCMHNNMNYFLKRTHKFEKFGRKETEKEANERGLEIKNELRKSNQKFIEIDSSEAVNYIMKDLKTKGII